MRSLASSSKGATVFEKKKFLLKAMSYFDCHVFGPTFSCSQKQLQLEFRAIEQDSLSYVENSPDSKFLFQ